MKHISSQDIMRFHSMIAAAENISIVTHTKPDGDALGSSIAMFHALKLYGKTGNIILANPIPFTLDFLLSDVKENILIHSEDKTGAENAIKNSDLIICLDFNAFHRTDSLAGPLTDSQAEKILIDHHLHPDIESFQLVFSKTDISSASELLYKILISLPCVEDGASGLPKKACTALMAGMTTDTNNFANSVYPSTLNMASDLLAAGVDRDFILMSLYNRFKESRVRLMGYILKDLMKITPDGVAYIVLDHKTLHEYEVEEGDTEGFVNIPLSIADVKMSIMVKEDSGFARVSIRSKKGVSANRCAQRYFNGGGHENASGGRLFIPKDIMNIKKAGEYIEEYTHRFMTEDNE